MSEATERQKEKIPPELRSFASSRGGVEAVVQRIGRDTFDLVLVDGEGDWVRGVFGSEENCRAVAETLGVTLHEGWEGNDLARRMNRRDHWGKPGGHRRAL